MGFHWIGWVLRFNSAWAVHVGSGRGPLHAIETIILHREPFDRTITWANAVATAAKLPVAPQRQGVVLLPDLSAPGLGLVVAMALVDAARSLARGREAAGFAMLRFLVSSEPTSRVEVRTLWTGLTIQLIRASRRMALCCGSTRMTSKYLYVESWLTQYELSTRRFGHRRPTRSSAVARSARWYLSWLTPWLVGLPASPSAPLPLRSSLRTETDRMWRPWAPASCGRRGARARGR